MKTRTISLTAFILLQSTLAGQAQSVIDRIQRAAPIPPPPPPIDPRSLFQGGGGGGGIPVPAGALPNCQLPADQLAKLVPKAEDIAKLIVVPKAEDIAKLVVVPKTEDIAKLVVVPAPEDIAKLVTIPAEEIAKKVIEIYKAPFEALGNTLGDKIKDELKSQTNALREWAWTKVQVPLWVVTILTALLASMIIGVPMKALLYRVPVKRDK